MLDVKWVSFLFCTSQEPNIPSLNTVKHFLCADFREVPWGTPLPPATTWAIEAWNGGSAPPLLAPLYSEAARQEAHPELPRGLGSAGMRHCFTQGDHQSTPPQWLSPPRTDRRKDALWGPILTSFHHLPSIWGSNRGLSASPTPATHFSPGKKHCGGALAIGCLGCQKAWHQACLCGKKPRTDFTGFHWL